MEKNSDAVAIGKTIDESSYSRNEKHIQIDETINIDFIKNKGVIHEVKKSNKIEEASIWQVKYYLYYLEKLGVASLKGKLDYPLLKRTVDIELQEEDRTNLEEILEKINLILDSDIPSLPRKKSLCKQCAYMDLCLI